MDLFDESETDSKDYLPRYKILYVAIFLMASLISGRLWYLQIIQGEELRQYSERNRVKETKIIAPRGLLLDRDGRVLVDNLPGFQATISPQYATRLTETAAAVGQALGLSEQKIIQDVQRSRRRDGPFRQVKIKDNLSLNEVLLLKMLRWDHPGLNINEVTVRHYPLGQNGAQLFGYVGEISKEQIPRFNQRYQGQFSFEQGDVIGKAGLEETWEQFIRGYDGVSFVEVDARGREAQSENPTYFGFKPQEAIPGHNVVLTIDKDLQEAVFNAMKRDDPIGPRIGAAVVLKTNGEILAWLSTPSYDPNEFATGISSQMWSRLVNDPFRPLRNKVIQDHYYPGSTFKPIVALAALQEKVIQPHTLIHSPANLRFGRRTYHDHTKTGHGHINVYEALERSSNVFFYKMGIGLGIDKMAPYARALGLGVRSGINLSNEVSGTIPDSEWKLRSFGEEWQPGENLSNAIGQGFILTTVLQMALTYNAIGQEGLLMSPLLVKRILNQNNEVIKEFSPEVARDVSQQLNASDVYISKANFKAVKEGLRRVGNGERGTARWWKIPGIQIAGKTGTSQLMSFSADEIYDRCDRRPITQRHHGWYVAFAPAEKPLITVAVLAEHACAGSTGAAPIVRDIMLSYFQKYHPDMIKTTSLQRNLSQTPSPAQEEVVE